MKMIVNFRQIRNFVVTYKSFNTVFSKQYFFTIRNIGVNQHNILGIIFHIIRVQSEKNVKKVKFEWFFTTFLKRRDFDPKW